MHALPTPTQDSLPDVMILPSGPRTLRRRSGVTTGVPPLHTVPDATVIALAALAAVTTATEIVETTVIAKGEGGVGLQNVDAANPQIAGGKDVMIGEVIEIGTGTGRGIGRGPRLLQMTLKKRLRLPGIGHRRRLMSTDC